MYKIRIIINCIRDFKALEGRKIFHQLRKLKRIQMRETWARKGIDPE